jgi:hypothetical protein
METQHEFIERRRLAHVQAALEGENDPLIKAVFGPHEPVVISQRERDAYCLPPGWMFRRQAGEPIDRSVSLDHTVIVVTELGSRGNENSNRGRRHYPLRWLRTVSRALLRLQQIAARLNPAR